MGPREARLADEAQWLRFTDLRADALYASILRAIAQGNTRPSAIARTVGRGSADEVGFQLQRLCEMRLVRRVVPVNEERQQRSRHALYLLADHYVAFWYRFVDRMRHLLALRRYDEALRSITLDFDRYVSEFAFEDVVRQYLWRALALDRLPAGLTFDALGGWWTDRAGEQDELDVLALRQGRAILVGECKWSVQPVQDMAGLDAALRAATKVIEPIDQPWRVLFARAGFAGGLLARAAEPGSRLLLIGLDELFEGVGQEG